MRSRGTLFASSLPRFEDTLLASAPVGLSFLDRDLRYLRMNDVMARLTGVELAPVVEGAVETTRPLLEARGHALAVSLPDEPLWLEADATRIEQVLANLLNNAAKFTEPGGHIGLSVERQGSEAVLRVRDTGAGIPPDLLPSVFDLFVQGERSLDRAHGGLGIGLTLVRSLVGRPGGTVEAASEGPGKGTEITVRLPLLSGAARNAPAPAAPPPDQGPETVRILLVEDNEDAAAALAELLRIWGHEVEVDPDQLRRLIAGGAVQAKLLHAKPCGPPLPMDKGENR